MLFGDTESALIAADAAKRTAQLALYGTGITALITLIVAFLAQRSAKKTQIELKLLELKNGETLAKLNATLGERKSEEDARRDYDYEARKRLYKECEPLLFRLSEASENALQRIFSLARTARMGDLGPSRPSWFQSPGYYMASTIYLLLVPLAIFRLLQNKLTLVDLTVDQRISNQYLIAKLLYFSFTEDFNVAQMDPQLECAPFAPDWENMRVEQPEKYWRQGITLGRLDNAVEGLIVRAQDGSERCMSFGEFETVFYGNGQHIDIRFEPFVDIFLLFHPAKRPILWRILVIQAYLHAKLMQTFMQHGATGFVTAVPSDFTEADLVKLDWRNFNNAQVSLSVILEPVQVAMGYVANKLPAIFPVMVLEDSVVNNN